MAEKLLVPIYVPNWLHDPLVRLKRAIIPQAEPPSQPEPPPIPKIDIIAERDVEWSFMSAEMPNGPGEAFDFGCEYGYMSLLAAQKGFHVTANDLQDQKFMWQHPNVEFCRGDFLSLKLPPNQFDLVINCSSVEHVGVAGRYGIQEEQSDADLDVMAGLTNVLKPGGCFLTTLPCGRDAVMAPWNRVYGKERLPRLLRSAQVVKERYWVKNSENQWIESDRESALNFEPRCDPENSHACAYALAGFVLTKH